MFRCISEVKGLVFDIDSFEDEKIKEIIETFNEFIILFMTSSEEKASKIGRQYGESYVYKMEGFQRFFAPNKHTHTEVLKKLGIQPSEVLYVSKNIDFLWNAMSFLGGTVWITEEISYKNASKAPDLICRSIERFRNCLKDDVEGFFGEIFLYPEILKKGMIIPVEYAYEDEAIPMYMLGRYFGYSQYMSQLHPYSSAIFLNKWKDHKSYGIYNQIFGDLISIAVGTLLEEYKIDGICPVPPRPGKEDRFSGIIKSISENYGILNCSSQLKCIKDYPSQKKLSYQERQDNIRGVFEASPDLSGKSLIIVDDIISTGATIDECITTLRNAGVVDVYIVVLAVNQPELSYWSSNGIQISCPKCGSKMRLLVNSYSKSLFYSCCDAKCDESMNYNEGRKRLINDINNEFDE